MDGMKPTISNFLENIHEFRSSHDDPEYFVWLMVFKVLSQDF